MRTHHRLTKVEALALAKLLDDQEEVPHVLRGGVLEAIADMIRGVAEGEDFVLGLLPPEIPPALNRYARKQWAAERAKVRADIAKEPWEQEARALDAKEG